MKYIVVEKAYEYNDEISYSTDGYFVSSKLYNTKEEAEAVARKSNINWGKGLNLGEYGYDIEPEVKEYIESIGGTINGNWECIIPETATDEEILQALQLAGEIPHYVISIEE